LAVAADLNVNLLTVNLPRLREKKYLLLRTMRRTRARKNMKVNDRGVPALFEMCLSYLKLLLT